MVTVPQVSSAVQRMSKQLQAHLEYLLNEKADELARSTKFVQRTSPISGSVFAQTLIFGFLDNPDSSYTHLQQFLTFNQVTACGQAIEKRMTFPAAQFLFELLRAMVQFVFEDPDPVAIDLYTRFEGVYVQDGSIIALPDSLQALWRGFGGSTGTSESALQIQARLNMSTGQLSGPWLQDGRACERGGEGSLEQFPLPAGALRLADLGFLTLDLIKAYALSIPSERSYFLSYANANWLISSEFHGPAMSLPDWLESLDGAPFDGWVWLGAKKAPVRLVAFPVSEQEAARRKERVGKNTPRRGKGSKQHVQVGKYKELPAIYVSKRHRPGKKLQQMVAWTVIITNVPVERLNAEEVRVLARSRWQIELLWKLWKQIGEVDTWRSSKPARILCEIYAKLMGFVLQHWLIQIGCWTNPHRSMVKASQAVRIVVPCLMVALKGWMSIKKILYFLADMMKRCTINTRKKRKNTSQLLLEGVYK
jgi:hypothetical protein